MVVQPYVTVYIGLDDLIFFYLNRAEPIALCTPISLTVYIGTVLFSVKKLSNPLVQNILQCSTICVGYWLFQHNIKELI